MLVCLILNEIKGSELSKRPMNPKLKNDSYLYSARAEHHIKAKSTNFRHVIPHNFISSLQSNKIVWSDFTGTSNSIIMLHTTNVCTNCKWGCAWKKTRVWVIDHFVLTAKCSIQLQWRISLNGVPSKNGCIKSQHFDISPMELCCTNAANHKYVLGFATSFLGN